MARQKKDENDNIHSHTHTRPHATSTIPNRKSKQTTLVQKKTWKCLKHHYWEIKKSELNQLQAKENLEPATDASTDSLSLDANLML